MGYDIKKKVTGRYRSRSLPLGEGGPPQAGRMRGGPKNR